MYANIGTPPNACWNTLGRVIKMRLGPESGCMPTEKAAGKSCGEGRKAPGPALGRRMQPGAKPGAVTETVTELSTGAGRYGRNERFGI